MLLLNIFKTFIKTGWIFFLLPAWCVLKTFISSKFPFLKVLSKLGVRLRLPFCFPASCLWIGVPTTCPILYNCSNLLLPSKPLHQFVYMTITHNGFLFILLRCLKLVSMWNFQARRRKTKLREACEWKRKLDSTMIGIRIHMEENRPNKVCPSTAMIFLLHLHIL